MQPIAQEIVIGLVVLVIGTVISKGYSWVNKQIDTWNDRLALGSLTKMDKDPASYADRMVRRQRLMLGATIYLLCCDLVLVHMGWPGMTGLKVSLAIAAAVCAL